MENVVAASAFVVFAGAYCELKKKRRKHPRWWIRSFLTRRDSEGAYNSLMRDLRLQSGFDNFVRMTAADFEFLLNLIGPEITKSRSCRLPISPGEMLAATLRYLATGDSYSSIMYLHRISKASISRFIPVVCKAIVASLKDYIPQNRLLFKQFDQLGSTAFGPLHYSDTIWIIYDIILHYIFITKRIYLR